MTERQSKALETCCYVVGAGAFGVFARWMQLMLAYNEEGVVDPSFWNFIVPGLLIVAALVFNHFIIKMKKKLLYMPEGFCRALHNEGKLFTVCRWVFGGIMLAGAALLFLESETDKYSGFQYALAACGALTAFAFPFMLTAANRPNAYNKNLCAFLAFMPILLFCVWIIVLYRENSINPVLWDFIVQIIAIILNIIAFFRVAGFAFGAPNEWRSILFCELGAVASLMTLPDDIYLGQKVMFAAAALMQILLIWIMLVNLKQGKRAPTEEEDHGFERLR